MVRMVFACSLVALLAVTAGCRMCAHPYDYCGPVFTEANGEPCDANVRRGSILSGGMVTTTVASADVEATEPQSEQVVEPAAELERQAGATLSDQPQRWTARRPVDGPR